MSRDLMPLTFGTQGLNTPGGVYKEGINMKGLIKGLLPTPFR